MEYALYNGLRTAAQPTLKAGCEHCGGHVIAKCGSKKIWHWAHVSIDNCDSWYEPETVWHRNWKHLFGELYSEIRVVKESVYHIADVINKDGIVFEFQNSTISAEMITIREQFYGEKMIWLINGESFKRSFNFYDEAFLKEWQIKALDEFETVQHYGSFANSLIIEDWRVRNEAVKRFLKRLDFVHATDAHIYYLPLNGTNNKKVLEDQINGEIKALYEKQKPSQDSTKGQFIWTHPRRSWEDAKRAIFIDFGEDHLFWVTAGMGKAHGNAVKIRKEKFIEKYSN